MSSSPAPAQPFPMRELEFVFLMAMMQALQALAIDVMLPALGVISKDLGVADPNHRQLVIGVFLIASGAAALFPGTLADRFGRRPVVLTCLSGYFVLSLASALVTNFGALLVLRALLGLFSAGMMIMPLTIIRDRFSGDKMARMQSLVAVVFMVVPMLAPLLGQGILAIANWRWIFGVMALISAAVAVWAWYRLPETLHFDNRQSLHLVTILGNMRLAITHRQAVGYFLGTSLIQAAILGYIVSAQQLVQEALGAGVWFPAIFGAMAALMASSNFVNASIVERFGARRVSHTALLAYIAIAAIHCGVAIAGLETLPVFVVLMSITFCLMSFIASNFQAIAMQPFARIAGSASSVLSFVRLVTGAALGTLVGLAFDGTAVPLLLGMLAAGTGALLLVLFSEHGRLFRRLNLHAAARTDL